MNRWLRIAYRLPALLIHALWAVLLLWTVIGTDPEQRTPRDWRIIRRWMARLCRLLGLHLHIQGEAIRGPALFVSNHISWHDIPVLQSLIPTGFIAKAEIRHWPLIGWMAHRGNTLFIQRGKHHSLHQIRAHLEQRLDNNQNILLFPEGSTSPGDTVLSFRTRLYKPAMEKHVPIQPIALYYRSPDKPCRELSFVDDEGFLHHLLRLLGEPRIDAYVRFGEAVGTAGHDRRELGERTQAQVQQALDQLKALQIN